MKTQANIKRERAGRVADSMKSLKHYDGEIEWKDLKGKPLEYVDMEIKIRVHRVIQVRGKLAEVEDVLGYHHRVSLEQVIGAWSRRGSQKYLKVIGMNPGTKKGKKGNGGRKI